jgi:hypothetical protein
MRSRVLAQALTSAAIAAAISTLAACGGTTANSASAGHKPAAAAQSGPQLRSAAHRAHRAHRVHHHAGAPAAPNRGPAASPAPAQPCTHTAANHTPANTGPKQGAQQEPQSQPTPAADVVRFGAVTAEDSNSTIDRAPDGLALTALFSDLEAKSDDGVLSNGTRMAIPLTGSAPNATITVYASGYVFTHCATARLILTLNGKPIVKEFASGTDDDFVEPIELPAIGGSTYQLSVAIDEQLSSGRGTAYINVSSIDAKIT